jgi:hypothetical protein
MTTPTGFRAESAWNPRASIAIPARYVTPRESRLSMLRRLTGPSDRPVDNPLASATAASSFDVACDAFGGDGGLG